MISVSKILPVQGAAPPIGAFHEDTAVDPRISVRWDVTKRFALKAAFEQ